MSDLSGFQYALLVYCALVVAKSILCYANVFTVLAVLQYKLGGRYYAVHRILLVLFAVPVTVAFTLPKLITEEGLSFFTIYSRYKTIRDMFRVL